MQKNPSPSVTHVALAVAAFGVDLAGAVPTEIRLLPVGEFRAKDGRPQECPAWIMTPEDGARIEAEVAQAQSAFVIDYEHATLHAKKSGTKAPAAGWFSTVAWRDDGLWAVGVEWTAAARQEINDTAYRYISPVFSYDNKSGRVLRLLHAALTNDPALDGLTDLAALATDFFLLEKTVNEDLLEQLRWLLNLPVGSSPQDIATHLEKLINQIKDSVSEAATATGFDLAEHLTMLGGKIVTLTNQTTPNPAQYVPVAALTALQAEHTETQNKLAALSAEIATGKLEALIASGKTAGKITPAIEAWAQDLGKRDIAALTAFIEATAPAVQPGQTQTGGKPPTGTEMTDSAAIAALARQYQDEQAAKGIAVSIPQAVRHVTKGR